MLRPIAALLPTISRGKFLGSSTWIDNGRRWASTLIYAQHDNHKLSPGTFAAISAATQLNNPVKVLVGGHKCDSVAAQAAKVEGVTQVLLADAPHLEHFLAVPTAHLLLQVQRSHDVTAVVGPICSVVRDVFPRFAALLDVQPVTDVVKINEDGSLVRPIYAGNVLCCVKSSDKVKIISVRPTDFSSDLPKALAPCPVTSVDFAAAPEYASMWWVSDDQPESSDRPTLENARIVVSGGRGLRTADEFRQVMEPLRSKLNAALGASRAVVDAGFVPNDLQVSK
eukprot:GHVT01090734.1.p1 GENE.GHVT01090734.1~~GHVT01090734.1.p1  ORF type:complete len:282 (-),score=41.83 GHVT01090734.1:1584-2429(-)